MVCVSSSLLDETALLVEQGLAQKQAEVSRTGKAAESKADSKGGAADSKAAAVSAGSSASETADSAAASKDASVQDKAAALSTSQLPAGLPAALLGLRGTPVLVTHGAKDSRLPLAMAKRQFEALRALQSAERTGTTQTISSDGVGVMPRPCFSDAQAKERSRSWLAPCSLLLPRTARSRFARIAERHPPALRL